MKEIVAEYPLKLADSSNPLSIFRFPIRLKSLKITEVRRKPISGLTEVSILFPDNNVSALKIKSINSNNITYRSLPVTISNYYYATRHSDCIILYRLNSLHLFEPCHHYYPVEKMKELAHRAESRDELERRKNSYVHRVRRMEDEEFKKYEYESYNKIQNKTEINPNLQNTTGIPSNLTDSQTVTTLKKKKKSPKEILKEISECVVRARIVNYQKLIELFDDRIIIGSVLARMTEPLLGRFVLKNSYYEKRLWEMRDRLMELFRRAERVAVKDTLFLGEEEWMVEELAYKAGSEYVLKGYKEDAKFDSEVIKSRYSEAINKVLESNELLSLDMIAARTGIDSELIEEIVGGSGYVHLANNCYILDDGTVRAEALKLFETTKVVDYGMIRQQIERPEEEVHAILKQYCTRRGDKFYLKNIIN